MSKRTRTQQNINTLAEAQQAEQALRERLTEARTILSNLDRKFHRRFGYSCMPTELAWATTPTAPLRAIKNERGETAVQYYDAKTGDWKNIHPDFYTKGTWDMAKHARCLFYIEQRRQEMALLKEEKDYLLSATRKRKTEREQTLLMLKHHDRAIESQSVRLAAIESQSVRLARASRRLQQLAHPYQK